jgi:hypothetical protein
VKTNSALRRFRFGRRIQNLHDLLQNLHDRSLMNIQSISQLLLKSSEFSRQLGCTPKRE